MCLHTAACTTLSSEFALLQNAQCTVTGATPLLPVGTVLEFGSTDFISQIQVRSWEWLTGVGHQVWAPPSARSWKDMASPPWCSWQHLTWVRSWGNRQTQTVGILWDSWPRPFPKKCPSWMENSCTVVDKRSEGARTAQWNARSLTMKTDCLWNRQTLRQSGKVVWLFY